LGHLTEGFALLLNDEAARLRVGQIKEKYAELRVYWRLGTENRIVLDRGASLSRCRLRSAGG
jgi:hypothetical protein